MLKKWVFLFFLSFSMPWAVWAAPLKLKPNYPNSYTVQPGDTLWTISEKYLDDPLDWPALLKSNPQISNPAKIYPGQILELEIRNGKPFLNVKPGGVIKLKPHAQITSISEAIPVVPINVVRPFLVNPIVLHEPDLNSAPYVVSQRGDRLVSGMGNAIYVENLLPGKYGDKYFVFRPGKPYIDPPTQEILGYPGLEVGRAQLLENGQPATLYVLSSIREIMVGDRVLPELDNTINPEFYPQVPDHPVKGRIISVLGGVQAIGQFNVVVINRGCLDGVQVGDLLGIFREGKVIKNPVKTDKGAPIVRLPNERAGELFIFRTFDRVSYGLILRAAEIIHVLDLVLNPRFQNDPPTFLPQ